MSASPENTNHSPDSSERPSSDSMESAAASSDNQPELSIVIPIFNESENICELYREIREAMGTRAFEVLFVDDGSTDGSDEVIRRLEQGTAQVHGVFFDKNRGQTAAMLAGCLRANAPLVATMDGDRQNDPADLPRLLDALGTGDAVVGMRTKRRDTAVRRISSKLANRFRNLITGDSITDTGCSLKLFKREAIFAVPRFEGLHRFLPTLMRYAGYQVSEISVNHRSRSMGTSKYGIWNRLPRATLDMLAVCWMRWRWVDLTATMTNRSSTAPAALAPRTTVTSDSATPATESPETSAKS